MKKIIIALVLLSLIGLSAAEYQLTKKEFQEIVYLNTERRGVPCPDGNPGCLVYHSESYVNYEEVVKDIAKKFGVLKENKKVVETIEETIETDIIKAELLNSVTLDGKSMSKFVTVTAEIEIKR